MKIAIDISPMQNDNKGRGTGVYTKLLIEALQKYEFEHSYTFFTQLDTTPQHVDVIHYPYFDPFFHTLPIKPALPTVVTVHDLIPIIYEKHFPRGIKGKLIWQVQKFALKRVGRIITDSYNSKSDIQTILKNSEDRIDVIYLAPRPFQLIKKENNIKKDVVTKYILPSTYVLYVGDVNWNKNLPGLIRAFTVLKKNKKFADLKLVLVGKAFLQTHLPEIKEINYLIDIHNLHSSILKLGFVDEEELGQLYAKASVCAVVSFAEGFGLPVLESMAWGTPVVAANTTSLKEIAGPALLVDPYDIDSISKGLVDVLSVDRKKWQKKAFAWIAQFSWKNVAHQTIESYRKVLDKNI